MTRTAIEVMYQTESLDAFIPDCLPLIEPHYEELAAYLDIPLDVNWEIYREAEAKNRLRIYTARSDAGQLLAYCLMSLGHHPHYRSSLRANQDVFYVDPEHRGGRIGWNLLSYLDEQLRNEGVQVTHQRVKVDHPQLGLMLDKQGYVPEEVTFTKRLDR